MSVSRWREVWLGVGGLVLLGLAWQVVGVHEVFGTSVSPLSAVFAELIDPARRSVFVNAARITAGEAVTGFGVALVTAAVVGLMVSLVPALRRGVDQIATVISAVPFVALAPILLATVGREQVAVGMSACTAFFPLYIAVVTGLGALPATVADVFSVFGSNAWRRLRLAQWPTSLPYVGNGLKVAMPLAIVGAVIGEWFGSSSGLGPVMLVAMRNYRMETMWAAVLATVALALTLYALVVVLEKAMVRRFG